MKELITLGQANSLMIAFIIIAITVGMLYGIGTKRVWAGLGTGAGIGIGNFAMWKLYNAVTAKLGLDTLKNLFVNLIIFAVAGIVTGVIVGSLRRSPVHESARRRPEDYHTH